MLTKPSLGNCGHIRIFESVSLTRYVEYTQPCPWCEIERLRAECTRLLARGDKAELELNSLKAHYARRAPDEPGECTCQKWCPVHDDPPSEKSSDGR